MPFGYYYRLLPLYPNFFGSRQSALVAYLCHMGCHTHTPQAYSHTVGVCCRARKDRTFSCGQLCDTGCCWGFAPPPATSLLPDRPGIGVSSNVRTEHTPRLEAQACFVHRGRHRHDRKIPMQLSGALLHGTFCHSLRKDFFAALFSFPVENFRRGVCHGLCFLATE